MDINKTRRGSGDCDEAEWHGDPVGEASVTECRGRGTCAHEAGAGHAASSSSAEKVTRTSYQRNIGKYYAVSAENTTAVVTEAPCGNTQAAIQSGVRLGLGRERRRNKVSVTDPRRR